MLYLRDDASRNGTFRLTKGEAACRPVLFSSGKITIITNLAGSSANGTLIGGSSVSKAGVVCNNITFDMTCNRTYTGTFAGGLDPASGALSLSGSVNGSQTCQFSNCKQDGLDIACNPPTGFDTIADPLTITGSLDKASFTVKGTLKPCPACAGDWSAGKKPVLTGLCNLTRTKT